MPFCPFKVFNSIVEVNFHDDWSMETAPHV